MIKKKKLKQKKKSLKNKINYLEFDKNIGNYYLQDVKEKYNNYEHMQNDIRDKQLKALKELKQYLNIVQKKTNLNKEETKHLIDQKKYIASKIKYLKDI